MMGIMALAYDHVLQYRMEFKGRNPYLTGKRTISL